MNTHHVDVNATDNSGLIPLHLAVFYGMTASVVTHLSPFQISGSCCCHVMNIHLCFPFR